MGLFDEDKIDEDKKSPPYCLVGGGGGGLSALYCCALWFWAALLWRKAAQRKRWVSEIRARTSADIGGRLRFLLGMGDPSPAALYWLSRLTTTSECRPGLRVWILEMDPRSVRIWRSILAFCISRFSSAARNVSGSRFLIKGYSYFKIPKPPFIFAWLGWKWAKGQ